MLPEKVAVMLCVPAPRVDPETVKVQVPLDSVQLPTSLEPEKKLTEPDGVGALPV